MSFNASQFLECIIKPVLSDFGLNSKSAQNLLLGTCAQESAFGTYLHQLGNGPALGVYQMEPQTHTDILKIVVPKYPTISNRLKLAFAPIELLYADRLVHDLWYATIMTRLHYYRFKESLPAHDDLVGLAAYWKQYYNTKNGGGTPEEFIENYKRYILI